MKVLSALIFIFICLCAPVWAQAWPEMSIEEIQANMQPGTDQSLYEGDSVWVTGVVTTRSGLFWAGTHITYYIQSASADSFAGILVYGVEEASADPVYEGDSIRIAGVVTEYSYGAQEDVNMTEIDIFDNVPLEFLGRTTPPEPTLVTCAELDTINGWNHGEPYEGMLVTLHDVTYVGSNSFNNWRLECNDGSGPVWVIIRSDSLPPAAQFLQEPGTVFDSITGVIYHRFDDYFLLPRYYSDIVYSGTAPIISGTTHSPLHPTPDNQVRILTTVVDPTNDLTRVSLFYRLNEGNWISPTMTRLINNQYEYIIPAQADSSVIDYYVRASDAAGDFTFDPQEAPSVYYSVQVLSPQPAEVTAIQETADPGPDGTYPSPLDGQLVEVEALVMSDHSTGLTNGFYALDASAARDGEWSSVFVFDNGNFDPVVGARVTIIGQIEEYNGMTELNVTGSNGNVIEIGIEAPPTPITFSTADIPYDQPALSEPYEGLYVHFAAVTVTAVNVNDFMIADNSGIPIMVNTPRLVSEYTPLINDQLPHVSGFVHYAFGAYQLYLGSLDAVGIEDELNGTPNAFALHQNYPNPFNPTTDITFSVPQSGRISLNVYNAAGQFIRTLTDAKYEVGHHTVRWDGLNEARQSVTSGIYLYQLEADGHKYTRRMLLLK